MTARIYAAKETIEAANDPYLPASRFRTLC